VKEVFYSLVVSLIVKEVLLTLIQMVMSLILENNLSLIPMLMSAIVQLMVVFLIWQ
jgi:hypothetical protein